MRFCCASGSAARARRALAARPPAPCWWRRPAPAYSAREARVRLPGGDLVIAWGADDHVLMTGDVELEFETVLEARYFTEPDA